MSVATIRRVGIRPIVLAVCLAAVLLAPCAALGDGDPASDVLLGESVFLPYQPAVSAHVAGLLAATIARARAAGFAIKVAIIESPYDLGAIPQLFGRPEAYARFLDTELSFDGRPRLLVVMPQGFGTSGAAAPGALAGVAIAQARRSDGLAFAAIGAVAVLARDAGHRFRVPPGAPAPPATTGSSPAPAVIAGLAVGVAAVGLSVAVILRRRRQLTGRSSARRP